MHLVNLTTAGLKRIVGLSFALFIYSMTFAQENSPYSRYGLGDIVLNQNIANRGMGGVAIADANIFNINFTNPASLGILKSKDRSTNTIFDIGVEIDRRTLKSTTSTAKYTATNSLISYLQIAFPIASKKMEKKGINWGLSFGLRPLTRINYKIEKNERLPTTDSLNTLYEGTGGLNQFNISTGVKIKNFSFGLSSGYTFGNKDYSSQLVVENDTVVHLKSNTQTTSNFGGIFLNAGIQYQARLNRAGYLSLGTYANMQQNLKARQDHVNETFAFDGSGGITPIDTVSSKTNEAGRVKLPATVGIGLIYQDSSYHWKLGVDFEFSNWKNYSYYGYRDTVQNSWILRVGAEYYPAKMNTPNKKYWSFVKYRAGFYVGPDYVKLDKTRINYAATLGATFPLTNIALLYRGGDEKQYVQLHTSIEYGGRGDKNSFSFRENTLRFNFGISMNARWFQKRSYY
ncbi:MAG: hypothetical protein ABIN36_15255 [Ferruginibacter sp.]